MKEKLPFDERLHQFIMKTDKNKVKNIIIGVLVAVLVIETVAFGLVGILGGKSQGADAPVSGEAQSLITINTKGMATEVVNAVKPMLEGIVDGEMPEGGLMGVVEKVVYSDMIVNTIMSISLASFVNSSSSISVSIICSNRLSCHVSSFSNWL